MAIQTETHAQRFGMVNLVHLINATVTFHAAESAGDVHRMVEINVIRQLVDLTAAMEKSSGATARLLWSELGESLAARLAARLGQGN